MPPGGDHAVVLPGPGSAGVQAEPTFFTAGGDHELSMIEGGVSLGQYMRSIRTNFPFGAGSQLLSLSFPGDWFWT